LRFEGPGIIPSLGEKVCEESEERWRAISLSSASDAKGKRLGEEKVRLNIFKKMD
jgi:hypothetical protein